MHELRPNDQRAKIAIAMIWVLWASTAFIIFYNAIIFPLSYRVFSDWDINQIFQIHLIISKILSTLYIIINLSLFITFIRWFKRAYSNLNTITNNTFYGESWAIKCWFIPFMNLYIPFLMMKELYEKTDNYLFERQLLIDSTEEYTDRLNLKSVNWWWAFIVLFSLVSIFLFLISRYAMKYYFMIGFVGIFSFIKLITLAISGIFTIKIIKNYSKAEEILFQLEQENEAEKDD